MPAAKLSLAQEKELVAQAQKDLRAFDALYEHYLPKIYRYLAFKTNNTETAEDLTAQTFCEAMEHLSSFEWRGISFGAWLYKIAYNLLMDHYRNPSQAVLEDDVAARDDQVAEVDQKWSLEKIYDALQTLSPLTQQVVALRVTEELSHREIALIVGKSEESVKVMYSRAVQALREKLVFLLLLLFTLWKM